MTTENPPAFFCTLCNRSFASKHGLADHKTISPRHPFYCRACDLDFPSSADLIQHLDSGIPIGSPQDQLSQSCVRCKITTPPRRLRLHIFRSSRHPHACRECLLDFHSAGALQRHRQHMHPVTIQNAMQPQTPVAAVAIQISTPVVAMQPQTLTNAPASAQLQNHLNTPAATQAHVPADPVAVTDPDGVLPATLAAGDLCCRRCKISFNSIEEQRQHLSVPIPFLDDMGQTGGRVRCRLCRVTFHDIRFFVQHLRWGDQRDRVTHSRSCFRCFVDFHTSFGLMTHIREVHGWAAPGQMTNPASPSTVPPMGSFMTEVNLAPTQPLVLSNPPVSSSSPASSTPVVPARPAIPERPTPPTSDPSRRCDQCCMTFETRTEHAEHVNKALSVISPQRDASEAGLECVKCKTTFGDMAALRSHLTSGLPAHATTCADCLVHFHRARSLQDHQNEVHSPESRPRTGTNPPSTVARQSVAGLPTTSLASTNPPPQPAPTPLAPPRQITPTRPVVLPIVQRQLPQRATRGHPRALTSNRSGLHRLDPPSLQQLSLADFTDSEDSDQGDIPPLEERWRSRNETRDAGHTRPGSHAGRTENRGTRIPHNSNLEDAITGPVSRAKKGVSRVSTLAVSCPLCLEMAVDLTSTPCGHVGCGDCLRQSVQVKPECPMCRQPLRLSQLHPLFI